MSKLNDMKKAAQRAVLLADQLERITGAALEKGVSPAQINELLSGAMKAEGEG